MASFTALNLMNRVRLFRRQPQTTVIETDEDAVTLQSINTAIGDVLDTRKWEFDLRHDGMLTTRAVLDGAEVTVSSAGASSAIFSRVLGVADADLFGDYVVRLRVDGSSTLGNTSIVLKSAARTTSITATVVTKTSFPDTMASLDAELHYAEYLLPDTVKEVVRVSYQEDRLDLDQVDPVLRYDELFPSQYQSGPPERVAVGGFDIGTYETGESVPEPKLRMAVWPVPDDEFLLNYSYYYRHPELSSATDTLVGVPPAVVNDIVLRAASTVMMTWDQNYAASHFTDLSRQQAAAKHIVHGGSNARRRTIGSFESGTSGVVLERGFPGKVIGP